jgi:prepilin-type N-terminal cleavage/methylation domain-containing protein
MRQSNTAFTLVEILIVVIILAVLAAIVVPQFQEGPIEARRINLRENLNKIRMQIALYRQQHNQYPSGAHFEEQMTQFTSQAGAWARARSDVFRYPPYLEQMPPNPITGSRAIRSTNDPKAIGPAATEDGGWWYNEVSGLFFADLTNEHVGPDGVFYCQY